jgi:isopenicillin N synthase-like dioxygenase
MRVLVRFRNAHSSANSSAEEEQVESMLATVLAQPAKPYFCTLPDRGTSLSHLLMQLQRTAEAKRVQLSAPVADAVIICARSSGATGAGDDSAEAAPAPQLFSVASDKDAAALLDGDQLHVLASLPSSLASAIPASLPSLSSTTLHRPPSPESLRLAEFDRCSIECTIPRTNGDAEAAVSTEAIAAAAASSDAASRRSFGAQLLASFSARGFVRLRFSDEELAALTMMLEVQRQFFALPLAQKDGSLDVVNAAATEGSTVRVHRSDYQKAHGFSSSKACRKEFFVVRQPPQLASAASSSVGAAAASAATSRAVSSSSSSASPLWSMPSTPASFSPAVFDVFYRLGRVCQHVTALLLEALGATPERVAILLHDSLRPARTDEANRFTSVIELFAYRVDNDDAEGEAASAAVAAPPSAAGAAAASASSSPLPPPLPCSIHSDASMLTLIPRCSGPPGLQLFNWQAGGWQGVEAQSRPDEAILFPGDMMQRVTNGAVLATPHRVAFQTPIAAASAAALPTGATASASSTAAASTDQPVQPPSPRPRYRYSCPFELFLSPDAIVDCGSLLGLPVDAVRHDCRPVLSAMEALGLLSQNLVSVNKTN